MSTRRKARINAMKLLYELDCTSHSLKDSLDHLVENEKLSKEKSSFVVNIVKGVLDNKNEIDDIIERFASAFPIEQMAVIDRNILRIAIYEILYNNDTPFKVAIDEAVELSKIFGSNISSRLVNGVLGSVVDKYKVAENNGKINQGG